MSVGGVRRAVADGAAGSVRAAEQIPGRFAGRHPVGSDGIDAVMGAAPVDWFGECEPGNRVAVRKAVWGANWLVSVGDAADALDREAVDVGV